MASYIEIHQNPKKIHLNLFRKLIWERMWGLLLRGSIFRAFLRSFAGRKWSLDAMVANQWKKKSLRERSRFTLTEVTNLYSSSLIIVNCFEAVQIVHITDHMWVLLSMWSTTLVTVYLCICEGLSFMIWICSLASTLYRNFGTSQQLRMDGVLCEHGFDSQSVLDLQFTQTAGAPLREISTISLAAKSCYWIRVLPPKLLWFAQEITQTSPTLIPKKSKWEGVRAGPIMITLLFVNAPHQLYFVRCSPSRLQKRWTRAREISSWERFERLWQMPPSAGAHL